ncbi:MAG TPA: DUF2946 family protein [Burkholderiales bacterium]|nr:DUF2946 family protein [Burkholderiales bacterium]
MDEIVLRGMAKWPDVPAVYGWLALDRRGEWRIRGERVRNPAISAFIGRNYAVDDGGCWYFQNGPQRVYVRLDYTPYIYRVVNAVDAPLALECHTGAAVNRIAGALLDESGTLLIETEHGIGLVDDRDLDRVLPFLIDANGAPLDEAIITRLMETLENQQDVPLWLRVRETNVRVAPVRSVAVAQRYAFVADPQPHAGEPACAQTDD